MPQNPPSDLALVATRLKSKTLVLYNTEDQENPCLIQYRGPIKSLSYTNQRSGKSLYYTMKGQENPGRIQYRSRSGKSLSYTIQRSGKSLSYTIQRSGKSLSYTNQRARKSFFRSLCLSPSFPPSLSLSLPLSLSLHPHIHTHTSNLQCCGQIDDHCPASWMTNGRKGSALPWSGQVT